ncbi:spermidine synthase [candidate division KSB1 bacterium]|nr:spermidine synthase [candidate division KSB1 bacterium]
MNKNQSTARWYIASSMFLTGLCGFVFECILSTSSTHIFGNSTKEWTFTISFMLLMMGLASYLQKFPAFIKNEKLIEQFIFIEMALALLGAFAPIILFSAHAFFPEKVGGFQIFLVGGIGFLIGLEIPVAQRINEKYASLAKNISDTIALDYIGAFVGAQLFYRYLLKEFPLEQISFVVAVFNYIVAVMAYWYFYKQGNIRNVIQTRLLIGFTATALIAGFLLTPLVTMSQRQKFFRDHVIIELQTEYQHIVVTRNARTGNHDLFLNGQLQFSGDDEERYHEPLVIPAITLWSLDEKRTGNKLNVLILGGGDGLAANIVRNYPSVNSITMVDIDPGMVKFCASNPVITQYNQDVFKDANVAVLKSGAIRSMGPVPVYYEIGGINDKRKKHEISQVTEVADWEIEVESFVGELQNQKLNKFVILNYDADLFISKIKDRKWDVIIIDFPDPRTSELAKLYSWEFYVKIRSILAEGGIMVTQATSPYYAKEVFLSIRRTMEAAGFKTIPYQGFVGSFGGNWGWIIGHLLPNADLDNRLLALHQMESFKVPTRYLKPSMFQSLRTFGKGDLTAEEYPDAINYLTSIPTLDVIYEKAWQKL